MGTLATSESVAMLNEVFSWLKCIENAPLACKADIISDFNHRFQTNKLVERIENDLVQLRQNYYNACKIKMSEGAGNPEICVGYTTAEMECHQIEGAHLKETNALNFNDILILVIQLTAAQLIIKHSTLLFDSGDFIREVKNNFQLYVYGDTANLIERAAIVERFGFLSQCHIDNMIGGEKHVLGFMTDNTSIKPEMDILRHIIKHKTSLAFDKFTGTAVLRKYLQEQMPECSADNIEPIVDQFHQEIGETSLDKSFSQQTISANNQIKKRSMKQYFTKPVLIEVLKNRVQAVQACLQDIPATLSDPLPTMKCQVGKEMSQTPFNVLKMQVNEYQKILRSIVIHEKNWYGKRDLSAVESRQKSLTAFILYLNLISDFTNHTKNTAIEFIKEIKSYSPRWRELSLLDKILDVLTLGAHALVRYAFFRPWREEAKLFVEATNDCPPLIPIAETPVSCG